MNLFVKVALKQPWHVGDYGCSSYFVPELFKVENPADLLGRAVLVPFRKQQLMGYIVEASTKFAGDYNVVSVRSITQMYGEPLFSSAQIELAVWMAHEYFASVQSCLFLFISAKLVKQIALELASDSTISRNDVKVLSTSSVVGLSKDSIAREQAHKLTAPQAAALQSVEQNDVVLLQGVTGSGKTEVYLQAAQKVVASGGSAIVLVPEISLTPQALDRFTARFGNAVAIIHSGLTPKRRHEQWLRAQSGEAKIVVGPRSALFAPLPNVKLIVVDEEHDASYKSDSSPRYVTREVVRQYAAWLGAKVIMGSATPSFEALYDCQQGRAQKSILSERINQRPLPPVEPIDMRSSAPLDPSDLLSDMMKQAIIDTVRAGHKAVLLLNRKGFATHMRCRQCGWIPVCEACDIPLSYLLRPVSLKCNHCGKLFAVPVACPSCQSKQILSKGYGTEQLETAVKLLLQKAKAGTCRGDLWSPAQTMGEETVSIYRLDANTASSSTKPKEMKGAAKILTAFNEPGPAILLGTQIVAKGLDNNEVTLVGVLNADAELTFPDFRSPERMYDLLEQVAGRAGRGKLSGRVLVQTYNPNSLPIQAVLNHNQNYLLKSDVALRKALQFPPYKRLVRLVFSDANAQRARQYAEAIHAHLSAKLPAKLGEGIGAFDQCYFFKQANSYRYHFLLRFNNSADLTVIASAIKSLLNQRGLARCRLTIDVDPQQTI